MENSIIIVKYFSEKDKELVSAQFLGTDTNINLNQDFVAEVRTIPSATYDIDKRLWFINAEYGAQVEALIRKCYPDCKIEVREYRINKLAERGSFAEAISTCLDLEHLGNIRDYLQSVIDGNEKNFNPEKAKTELQLCIDRMKYLVD